MGPIRPEDAGVVPVLPPVGESVRSGNNNQLPGRSSDSDGLLWLTTCLDDDLLAVNAAVNYGRISGAET